MIKVYCDKCGKEIVGTATKVIESIDALDGSGGVLVKINQETHICDECRYNELTCGFKVGDQVITDDGRVGIIKSICDCESCKKRGFYEPNVETQIGDCQIWITDTDKRNDFMSFYKIGDQIFGNIDVKGVLRSIENKKEEITNAKKDLLQLEAQLNVLDTLK